MLGSKNAYECDS